jgi:Pyruvate/2-oxoacid:ferredoxin oxidoreductase gamma subunit
VVALNNNITSMEKGLTAPVESKASSAMAAEIRQHFARLEMGPRMNALRKAIESGDEATATAVLGAPSYLSGLDPELHAEYQRDWHEAQKPIEAKKVRAMRQAADMLNERYALLKKGVEKAVGTHDEYQEDSQGRRVLIRTWTAGEIRNRVKASNERFAVPV